MRLDVRLDMAAEMSAANSLCQETQHGTPSSISDFRTGVTMLLLRLTLVTAAAVLRCAQSARGIQVMRIRKGHSFIETKFYSADEDEKFSLHFEGLRVADVSDGMDQAGWRIAGWWRPRSARCGATRSISRIASSASP